MKEFKELTMCLECICFFEFSDGKCPHCGTVKTIETLVCEAASDYKLGVENDEFAKNQGGLDELRKVMFELVIRWGG